MATVEVPSTQRIFPRTIRQARVGSAPPQESTQFAPDAIGGRCGSGGSFVQLEEVVDHAGLAAAFSPSPPVAFVVRACIPNQ